MGGWRTGAGIYWARLGSWVWVTGAPRMRKGAHGSVRLTHLMKFILVFRLPSSASVSTNTAEARLAHDLPHKLNVIFSISHLLPGHDSPSPNQVVRVPRKQRLAIRAPRQTHAFGLPALFPNSSVLGLQFINLALLLQVKDDDA